MQAVKFVVNETPYACWDWELKKKNIEFLEGIDASYFAYIAEMNFQNIDGDNKQKAALALRLGYSQGLEALFALLCSAIQAPYCSIGWLLTYRNKDLIDVVNKISDHKPVLTLFKEKPVTWKSLAKLIHSNISYEEDKKAWIQEGFGKLWTLFAFEFVNEKSIQEFNCIEHGHRAKPGGFALAVGPEDIPGQPAAPEKMMTLANSDFGSSYFVREQIIASDRRNFRPRRSSRNWSPFNIAQGLLLLSMSINNVTSWLRTINGVPGNKCRFDNPISKDAFDQPWKENVGVNHIDMDLIIEESNISPFSANDILKSYPEL